jgi:PNKP adenylyltransferase domain, C-terminal region
LIDCLSSFATVYTQVTWTSFLDLNPENLRKSLRQSTENFGTCIFYRMSKRLITSKSIANRCGIIVKLIVGAKRNLALRGFALGVEALERFVAKLPLRQVNECVFGVLVLESEPIDPRL